MIIDPDRYYIFDCLEKMIGNPFGYKTHSAASAQTSRKDCTIYIHIWRTYRATRAINPKHNLICMIKQGAVI